MITVTQLRKTRNGVDEYGIDVWTTAETTLSGCLAWPSERSETVADRDTVATRLNLVVPPGTDVEVTDSFRLAGRLYEVDGEAWDWTSALTGWRPGVLVPLKRTEG